MTIKSLAAHLILAFAFSSSAFASDTCVMKKATSVREITDIASELVDAGYKVISFTESQYEWRVFACKQK